MNRKGFAPLIIIGIVVILIIAGLGIWYFIARRNSASPNGGACTADAKECPDGSWVGRTGPNCEFAACPTAVTASSTSWKTFTSAEGGFSFQYPDNLFVENTEGGDEPIDAFLSRTATSVLEGNFDFAASVDDLNPNNLSVKEYYNGYNGTDLYSGATVSTTTIDSLPAVRFDGSIYDAAPQETIIVPYQGGFLRISNEDLDDNTFNLILSSFHIMLR